ncbi:MAG: 50S ribosomal protein L23 [Gammaproteobacteria bacterium]|nr:50S ribosomal protein L23 [Gammaproteobacteria bacterium]
MNELKIFKVLKSPHVSEKSATLADSANQHVFKVSTDSTKKEIKDAVEGLFSVKVSSVRTVNVKGKAKRHGQRLGRRSDWKKAYVTLEEGHDIEIATAG